MVNTWSSCGGGGLTPLQRWSRRILSLQSTGLTLNYQVLLLILRHEKIIFVFFYINITVIIIIIIIKGCWQHRVPDSLFRNPFLLFFVLGRRHPLSAQGCPCVGIHSKMSLMDLSLILQQCPSCLACFTWMVSEMGGKWPYNSCFVDLFKTTRSIIV